MLKSLLSKANYIDLSRVSYLIADRNWVTRNILMRVLRNFSATDVRETSTTRIALDMIVARPPEIIFLGLVPGRTDEIDFLKTLRQSGNASFVYIPTIVLFEAACAKQAATAVGLGADSSIIVPFSAATIEAHLLRVLGDHRFVGRRSE